MPRPSAAFDLDEAEPIPGIVTSDGAYLEGGGQLVRSASSYAVVLERPVQIRNVRGGRKEPGLRPAHAAALDAVGRLSKASVRGVAVGSRAIRLVPAPAPPGGPPDEANFLVDAGTGGSTMLMLQALLPVMVARSAARGGQPVEVTFRGGTNVAPPEGRDWKPGAPQVDFVQLVLFPMLRKLFGMELEIDLRKRGFFHGGGEVVVRASTPRWPLPACELLDRGDPTRVHGVAFRSAGVPQHVLPRLIEGQVKKRAAGAGPVLQSRLNDTVPVEWDKLEVPSTNGVDGCGLTIVLETSNGCLLAGDSMGRKGTPAETVGEEAARSLVEELDTGGCVDVHLADQLIVFMVLAEGTSRLRLGKREPSLHTKTAVWLAGEFGATGRLVEDSDGWLLEVDGIGGSLVKR